MNLNKRLEITQLYQIYKLLLTEKQRLVFEMYFEDDYSINEICEVLNITKNGVYNTLKQAEKKLLNLEKNLKINEKYRYNCEYLASVGVSEKIIEGIK